MNINGVSKSLVGLTFGHIGDLLLESSPKKDGLGLTVELTEEEEDFFTSHVGMTVGYAIADLIADAVKAKGGDPSGIKYVYSDQVFRT